MMTNKELKNNFFEEKIIVVTGGAGSIGSALVKRLEKLNPKSIRVLDIDEYGLFKLKQELPYVKVRCLLGDIRDKERIRLALKGADIVVHCAALKHVDINEYNPDEAIKTNVLGTMNVLKAAIEEESVKKVVFAGSDKACNPVSLYGTTKLLGELLFKWADEITQNDKVFSIARFCNVKESRGNLFEVWRGQIAKGQPITITDKKAKRYFMLLEDAVDLIISCVAIGKGKEIFIPNKCEFKQIGELAEEFCAVEEIEIGLKPGEKLVEELLTEEEKERVVDKKDFKVIE